MIKSCLNVFPEQQVQILGVSVQKWKQKSNSDNQWFQQGERKMYSQQPEMWWKVRKDLLLSVPDEFKNNFVIQYTVLKSMLKKKLKV